MLINHRAVSSAFPDETVWSFPVHQLSKLPPLQPVAHTRRDSRRWSGEGAGWDERRVQGRTPNVGKKRSQIRREIRLHQDFDDTLSTFRLAFARCPPPKRFGKVPPMDESDVSSGRGLVAMHDRLVPSADCRLYTADCTDACTGLCR